MANLFLKFNSFDGVSAVEGFEKQVEISSFSHGFSQATSALPSSRGGTTSSMAYHNYITFYKNCSLSSVDIVRSLWEGIPLKSVVLTCRNNDSKSGVNYLKIFLENAVVSNYEINCDGEIAQEVFSLNYTKVKYEYTHMDDKKKPKGVVATSHDLIQNTVS